MMKRNKTFRLSEDVIDTIDNHKTGVEYLEKIIRSREARWRAAYAVLTSGDMYITPNDLGAVLMSLCYCANTGSISSQIIEVELRDNYLGHYADPIINMWETRPSFLIILLEEFDMGNKNLLGRIRE